MKEVKEKDGIHIDITNKCIFSCTNCYKFVGHHSRPYFMNLETVKKAIDSLEGYQGLITITGGEPLLHPDFAEICEYLEQKVPPGQRYLQTTGHKFTNFESIINRTFPDQVWQNDHNDKTQRHHPMLVAIKDVVKDSALREELIDNCWVMEKWSAVINSKGCFSCEIAGAFDVLYDGPGGLLIEKGWWTKGNEHFRKQLKRYCNQCGAALPQPAVKVKKNKDHISISHFNRLKNKKTYKFQHKQVLLVDKTYSTKKIKKIAETWEPWNHWGKKNDVKSLFHHFLGMVRRNLPQWARCFLKWLLKVVFQREECKQAEL